MSVNFLKKLVHAVLAVSLVIASGICVFFLAAHIISTRDVIVHVIAFFASIGILTVLSVIGWLIYLACRDEEFSGEGIEEPLEPQHQDGSRESISGGSNCP